MAGGAAEAVDGTGRQAKVGGGCGGSQRGEGLIDCGLLDVTQPEVGGAARVVGQAAFHALLRSGWQGDTGHRRCIRLMAIATAQCSGEFFASDHVTRYARSLTGYGLSQEGFQVRSFLFGQSEVGHFGPR